MIVSVLAALIAADAPAATAAPSPQTAVIRRSASTNTPGYSIVVTRDGGATLRTERSTQSSALPKALAARLYADLDRAGALGELPAGRCMKSASFGTTTVIAYGGQSSPDLQCAQNAMERTLAGDARAVSQALVPGVPVRREGPFPIVGAPPSPP